MTEIILTKGEFSVKTSKSNIWKKYGKERVYVTFSTTNSSKKFRELEDMKFWYDLKTEKLDIQYFEQRFPKDGSIGFGDRLEELTVLAREASEAVLSEGVEVAVKAPRYMSEEDAENMGDICAYMDRVGGWDEVASLPKVTVKVEEGFCDSASPCMDPRKVESFVEKVVEEKFGDIVEETFFVETECVEEGFWKITKDDIKAAGVDFARKNLVKEKVVKEYLDTFVQYFPTETELKKRVKSSEGVYTQTSKEETFNSGIL